MAVASPKTYAFEFILAGVDVITAEMGEALFLAGCDDASPSSGEGIVTIRFDREATSLSEAVGSAIADVEKAGFIVARVAMDIPLSRWVRCVGRIEDLRNAGHDFSLVLADGSSIACVVRDAAPGLIAEFAGQTAAVSGLAVFDSSWRVARIEADHAATPMPSDFALWSEAPAPLEDGVDWQSLRRPQGEGTGVSAILGQWPGDETDDEIDALVEQIS